MFGEHILELNRQLYNLLRHFKRIRSVLRGVYSVQMPSKSSLSRSAFILEDPLAFALD